MQKIKFASKIFLFLSITLLIFTPPAFSDQESCEGLVDFVSGLTDETLDQPLTDITATWMPADGDAPDYCEVRARIFPETDFALRLPTPWAGRYLHQGGGAWDGKIYSGLKEYATLGHVLSLGYANSSSNGGHDGLKDSMGKFALKDPYYQEMLYPDDPNKSNPYSCQKLVDLGNRALREVPLAAKKIINKYYGADPHHTYYWGTSTGGREGLVSAQLDYDIYDGLFIGWPTGGHAAVTFRGAWDTFQGLELAQKADPDCGGWGCATVYSEFKAALHYKSVYDKCDGLDGLEDGVIDDPRICEFDALTDLPACTAEEEAVEGVGGEYSSTCFTLSQRQAISEIYRGPHNSSGQLYIGQQLSAEYLSDPNNGTTTNWGAAVSDGLALDYYRYVAFDPPAGPDWDPATLDFETLPDIVMEGTCEQCYDGDCKTYYLTDELDAVALTPYLEPNMGGYGPLKEKGGKIIMQTGYGDGLVSALTSTALYETVLAQMGTAETQSFWKLYMAPGMGHGGEGVGGLPVFDDYMPKLVNWVENGVEPTTLTQIRTETEFLSARTRPLCTYPMVARYSGSGSIDEAANFMCVPPIEVSIKPKTINLKKKGVFTAFITVPEGYDLKDWNIEELTCEGAPAVRGKLSKNKYIAKFRARDLVDVEPGQAVELTVKGAFNPDDAQVALIQASDKVRVIGKKKNLKNRK